VLPPTSSRALAGASSCPIRGHIQNPALGDYCGIELQTADHMNRFRPTAEFSQFGRILLVLGADAGQEANRGRKKNPKRR